ncbi:cold-shock protein [Streptomyces sp. NPDC057101]|uniref:cold-shock protein n=1 Tax=Streptomyces sp. NPDC057101 TaxID=3346020 RepID=UPI00362590AF
MANPVVGSDVRGTVKWFDAEGFGFLAPDTGGDGERPGDVFVHGTAIVGQDLRPIKDDERVLFDLALGTQGLQAVNVRRVG